MKFSLIILIVCLFLGCKSINPLLVGTWKGEDGYVNNTIANKKWVFTRFANGTYTVNFKYDFNGKFTELTENGTWKTKNNIYYEKTKEMKKYDSFVFEIKNDSTIKYTAIKLDKTTDVASKNVYSFIDHKITK